MRLAPEWLPSGVVKWHYRPVLRQSAAGTQHAYRWTVATYEDHSNVYHVRLLPTFVLTGIEFYYCLESNSLLSVLRCLTPKNYMNITTAGTLLFVTLEVFNCLDGVVVSHGGGSSEVEG